MAEPVEGLVLDPRNARKHSKTNIAAIAASLKKHGQLQPIVVNDRNNQVVVGNGRLAAAQELGWEYIAVLRRDMTPAQQSALAIADNRSSELATWNVEVLNSLLLGIDDAEPTLIDDLLLDDLFDSVEVEGQTDPDATPEPPADPITKPGDLWILGDHRLLCGDSTKAKDVGRLMDGAEAMLMATDPPYGVDFAGAKYNPRAKEWDGIANDKLQGENLEAFIGRVLEVWLPHVCKHAGYYFWSAPMHEGAVAAAAIRKAGLHIQSQIIWCKNHFSLGQSDYHWQHEICWYAFWKGEKHRWLGGRDQTTVWEVNRVASNLYVHPMQKPVELYAIPMKNHTYHGEVVAEPFSGSGSQFIAAEQLGRRCYGMEISPAYCDVIVKRWEDFTGHKARRQ